MRTAENNQVLSDLLGEAVKDRPLNEILGNCLDRLLELSWLALLPKAGIFLVERNAAGVDYLSLVAERNLGEPITTLCSQVAFGHCLCGRAALFQKTVHANCVDHRHETLFEGIRPHGHYNVPIVAEEKTIGVIVLYLPHGTERSDEGVAFLEKVASTLALVITLNKKSIELADKVLELDYQKMALDAHAIVSVTDVRGRITYINDKFCEISGYTRDELIGSNHRMLKSGEHDSAFYQNLWRTISQGRVWHGEIKNRRRDGSYYWVAATIVPFMNTKGKPFQYVAVRTDITLDKDREEELKIAYDMAERANQSKSEFLATMSHEIRTPMTGVMGFADILLTKSLDGESKTMVRNIKRSAGSLMTILNDILDLSKLEAGKLEVETLAFDFEDFLHAVMSMFPDKIEKKDGRVVHIGLELEEGLPCGIRSDPTRIRQVLINLIGNAKKFTESGSIILCVRRIVRPNDGPYLRFEIKDTGIGIPDDVKPLLFAEYMQADSSIARKFEGTGLGLAICKKLISILGGDIGFESTLGAGSIFWFDVPLVEAEIEDALNEERIGINVDSPPTRSLHVLIVDDNALNRQIVMALMEAFGHTFETTENGLQAVERYEAADFDLILMDVRMPVMSGPDATRVIRKMGAEKADIPIIALSADAMAEHQKSYLDAGMNAVVPKPIDRIELASAINRVFGTEIHVLEKSNTAVSGKGRVEEVPSDEAKAALDDLLTTMAKLSS